MACSGKHIESGVGQDHDWNKRQHIGNGTLGRCGLDRRCDKRSRAVSSLGFLRVKLTCKLSTSWNGWYAESEQSLYERKQSDHLTAQVSKVPTLCSRLRPSTSYDHKVAARRRHHAERMRKRVIAHDEKLTNTLELSQQGVASPRKLGN